jgi:beta-lactamase superfamily II metal-dependent hydrolase
MKWLIGLLALFLVFGCVGEEPPQQNVSEENETDEPPPVTIIIEDQKNQTTEGDVLPDDEPDENETIDPSVLDFIIEEGQPAGIFFIDVADKFTHGNSVLIKKGELDILLDAGSKENANEVINFLNSRAVDDIEVLISTNPDPRNYGGLETVIEHFDVEHFWWSGESFGDSKYESVAEKVSAKAKQTLFVEEGFTKEIGGMTLEVLNPPVVRFDDVNNDAIVLKVTEGNVSILLLSGIQKGAVQNLANDKASLIKTDVMMAPYYGTGEGTRDIGLFLLAAEPEYVIVTGSSDDSAENGGSREPFERLMEQYGIEWSNTYENGTLRVTTDGSGYVVQNVSTS